MKRNPATECIYPKGRATPQAARSGVLRTEPCCTVSALRAPATIADRIYGSEQFIRRSRNPEIEAPARFVPTVKGENDVVI
jgi:hypothetical protein